jgi:hypothetical protein
MTFVLTVEMAWMVFILGWIVVLFPIVTKMESYNTCMCISIIGFILLAMFPFLLISAMAPTNINSDIFDTCQNKASLSDYSIDQLENAYEYYESKDIYLDYLYNEIEYRKSMQYRDNKNLRNHG